MRLEGEFRKDLVWEQIDGAVCSLKNSYTIGNNKHGQRHIIKNEKMRQFEASFDRQCRIYKDKNINRPCKLHVVVYEPSWSWDLDNAVTSLCDALQRNHAVVNDNLIQLLDARKVIDPSNPRIVYALEQLEPRLF